MREICYNGGTMMRTTLTIVALAAVAFAGCVRMTDVRHDEALRQQAYTAFAAGDFHQARRFVAQADGLYVPQGRLWRRTLDLRMATAEGSQHGELRRFLEAWGEQRDDWDVATMADATLTLAEALKPAYATDWLYDFDTTAWPLPLRTRYNLLVAELQRGQGALHDDTVARWRLGVNGLYASGRISAAAREAMRCARETRNAEAALIAAKLRNELGDADGRAEALALAETLAPDDPSLRQEAGLIRAARLGAKIAF